MLASFDYVRPGSITELFERLGQGARIYAGGTDLLVLLRSGKIGANRLIDIKDIPEFHGIREEDGEIVIGAAESFTEIYQNPLIVEKVPALAAACRAVGSPQIRNKGTLGGNIQNSSPAGDGLNACFGLDGSVKLVGKLGHRVVKLKDFILGPRKTLLRSDEVLAEIRLPDNGWNAQKFFKVGRRNALAISVVNGMVALKTDGDGRIDKACITLGAVAPTPLRIQEAEAFLLGKRPDVTALSRVETLVRNGVSPISDLRASKEYRSYIAGVSVRRAFEAALEEM